jgi:hypothetical protein
MSALTARASFVGVARVALTKRQEEVGMFKRIEVTVHQRVGAAPGRGSRAAGSGLVSRAARRLALSR